MKAFLSRLLAFFAPPPGWALMGLWAPPIAISAASPLWREAIAANDEVGVALQPAAEPAPTVAARRAQLRLVLNEAWPALETRSLT